MSRKGPTSSVGWVIAVVLALVVGLLMWRPQSDYRSRQPVRPNGAVIAAKDFFDLSQAAVNPLRETEKSDILKRLREHRSLTQDQSKLLEQYFEEHGRKDLIQFLRVAELTARYRNDTDRINAQAENKSKIDGPQELHEPGQPATRGIEPSSDGTDR